MRVSQRLDYALRALTVLAQGNHRTPVVAGDLAVRLNLPKRFLEQQMTLLARQGIVACQRGAGGGCSLARSPERITVADVVKAVEGDIVDVPHVTESAVSEMWQEVARDIESRLEDVTVADLARRQSEMDTVRQPIYYI